MAVLKVNKTMEIVKTIQQLQALLNRNTRGTESVGFVPTMGFLHEGHLALVDDAKKENNIVVMSIFVNPTQFGPGEDYEAYPRNEKRDAELAASAGVDILFIPDRAEMYPRKGDIHILPGAQATALCGASRPGHFDGVLKIILKLFNIVDPDHSYFGMKDAQQLAIIETFVENFNLRTTIERVPTVREEDGLAKSSRNVNLTEQERLEAPVLIEALKMGEKKFREKMTVKEIEGKVAAHITTNSSGTIDYVSLLAYPSLTPVTADAKEVIIACAVKFAKTRLIDNIIISTKG